VPVIFRHLREREYPGISVESGIPPFRGRNGLWEKYDPSLFEISYFMEHPAESWKLLKKIFYESFAEAEPNEAHRVLARLEKKGVLKALITQNIDNLHYEAGNRKIVEYHGTLRNLICMGCQKVYPAEEDLLKTDIPRCDCGAFLKPDIIFFGELIPLSALEGVEKVIKETDTMIIIGTTGEVYPASMIPHDAKRRGAGIIEVNVQPSNYTNDITDIFLQGSASEIMKKLEGLIYKT